MRKLYILTVDEAQFIRDLISKTIRNRFPDTQVDQARDGEEAQQMMEAFKYDLVLSELDMEDFDGLELLNWTREHSVLYTQPFIFVTNNDSESVKNEAVQAGVSAYITKPFTSDQLINTALDVLLKNELITEEDINSSTSVRQRMIEKSANYDNMQMQQTTAKSRGVLGKALVVYGENRHTFFIRNINLTDITLIQKNIQKLPNLKQECLVGVVASNNNEHLKMSIRSYCVMTQLLDKNNINSQTSMIKLNFMPLDVEQSKLLNRIIQSLHE